VQLFAPSFLEGVATGLLAVSAPSHGGGKGTGVGSSRREAGEHCVVRSCFPASGCSISLGARMVRHGAELKELTAAVDCNVNEK